MTSGDTRQSEALLREALDAAPDARVLLYEYGHPERDLDITDSVRALAAPQTRPPEEPHEDYAGRTCTTGLMHAHDPVAEPGADLEAAWDALIAQSVAGEITEREVIQCMNAVFDALPAGASDEPRPAGLDVDGWPCAATRHAPGWCVPHDSHWLKESEVCQYARLQANSTEGDSR